MREVDPTIWYFGALIVSIVALIAVQRRWIKDQITEQIAPLVDLVIDLKEDGSKLEQQLSDLQKKSWGFETQFSNVDLEIVKNQRDLTLQTSGQYLLNNYILTMLILHLEQLPEFKKTGWNKDDIEEQGRAMIRESIGWEKDSKKADGQ